VGSRSSRRPDPPGGGGPTGLCPTARFDPVYEQQELQLFGAGAQGAGLQGGGAQGAQPPETDFRVARSSFFIRCLLLETARRSACRRATGGPQLEVRFTKIYQQA